MKYLFTVRHGTFGRPITLDSFFPITIDEKLLDPEVVKGMSEFGSDKINEDYQKVQEYIHSTTFRLRFNQDMYQSILVVSTDDDYGLNRELLEVYLTSMSSDELLSFLKESEL